MCQVMHKLMKEETYKLNVGDETHKIRVGKAGLMLIIEKQAQAKHETEHARYYTNRRSDSQGKNRRNYM